jgi:hypothetical protein
VALGTLHRLGTRLLEDHRLAAVGREAQQTVADHARDPDTALGVEVQPFGEGTRAELGDGFPRTQIALVADHKTAEAARDGLVHVQPAPGRIDLGWSM